MVKYQFILRYCGRDMSSERLTGLAVLSRNMLYYIRDHSGTCATPLTFGGGHSDISAILAFKRGLGGIPMSAISQAIKTIKRQICTVLHGRIEMPNMIHVDYASRARAVKFIKGGCDTPFRKKRGRPKYIAPQTGPIMPIPTTVRTGDIG